MPCIRDKAHHARLCIRLCLPALSPRLVYNVLDDPTLRGRGHLSPTSSLTAVPCCLSSSAPSGSQSAKGLARSLLYNVHQKVCGFTLDCTRRCWRSAQHARAHRAAKPQSIHKAQSFFSFSLFPPSSFPHGSRRIASCRHGWGLWERGCGSSLIGACFPEPRPQTSRVAPAETCCSPTTTANCGNFATCNQTCQTYQLRHALCGALPPPRGPHEACPLHCQRFRPRPGAWMEEGGRGPC